ncbi:MAG: ferredoxin [Candidatus Binatia bacterium]
MVTDALARGLAPYGVNLVGATSVAEYDGGRGRAASLAAAAPGAIGTVVLGNGGGAFWEAFERAVAGDPSLATAPDPLDAFTRRVVEGVAVPLLAADGVTARVVYPFASAAEPVSFVRLAACAGLGRPSLLGVLVHPVWGPWIALRAALLLPIAVEAPRPADGFDPCPTCVPRPCVAACPATAVTDAGWDLPRCAAHRGRPDDACAVGCHARIACVLGRAHRYPPAALLHHQAAVRGALIGTRT